MRSAGGKAERRGRSLAWNCGARLVGDENSWSSPGPGSLDGANKRTDEGATVEPSWWCSREFQQAGHGFGLGCT